MQSIAAIIGYLEELAPTALAESWDNVGLLVGNRERIARRVMTCLTVTRDSAAEAVDEQVDLLVAHHPLPFRPLARLTADTPDGRRLLELLEAGIALYSPHTAFDSAGQGINQRLAEGLGLREIAPLVVSPGNPNVGTGRWGRLASPLALGELAAAASRFLGAPRLQAVGDLSAAVSSVGVGCGSGGELLEPAQTAGCQAFVTGEARFHTALEAEARGLGLLLVGHYASERFGVEALAQQLSERFSDLEIWASRRERDPLAWV
jgi:dinuclear metal center YbgI/SA1388 family protein